MKRLLLPLSVLTYRLVAIRLPHTFWPGGMLFSRVRKILLQGMGCSIGSGCEIEPHVDVGFRPELKIGDCCQINQNVIMRYVEMGDDVMIAPGVVLLDRFHHFDRLGVPMAKQGESDRKLVKTLSLCLV